MKRYSVGFLFTHSRNYVSLVTKARPEWQKGKLNGIGGHIEDGETPLECMIREYEEEAGLHFYLWQEAIVLSHDRYQLNIFRGFLPESAGMPIIRNPDVEEPVAFYQVSDIPILDTIPNLKWIVPLLLDSTVGFPINIRDTGH